MPRYTKRPDGRYMTHVTIGTHDNGKPKRKTVYAKTIRELEDKCAEIRRQIAEGTLVSGDKILVADWARDWLYTYKKGLAFSTRRNYRTIVEYHIIPKIGQLKLDGVRAHHLQKMINDMADKGLTDAIRKTHITLNQIFDMAAKNNFLTKNPAEYIVLPKREKPKKRALTEIEKQYILEAELDAKSRMYLMMLLYTGLRKSEALALTKDDFNMADKTVTIDKTLITVNNQSQIKNSPKSKAGFRVIPMPDILCRELDIYLSQSKWPHIFPSASGKYMSDTSFRRFWKKIIERLRAVAGGNLGKDITSHIFRHTYATMLYYAGVDIKTAQYLLGHASIGVTMEIYTHLDDEKTKTAAEKINAYMSK